MRWTGEYYSNAPTPTKRKDRLDREYNWSDGGKTVKLLKSSMIGPIYHGIVEIIDGGNIEIVRVLKWKPRKSFLSHKKSPMEWRTEIHRS